MASNLTKLSNLKRSPMPGPRGHKHKDLKSCVTESEVKAILINNPKVFDSFVLECVSQERLENLLSAKKQRPVIPGIPEPCFPLQHPYNSDCMQEITKTLTSTPGVREKLNLITSAADVLGDTLNANSVTVYLVQKDGKELASYKGGRETPCGPVGLKMTVAAHVAVEKKSLIVNDLKMDNRFPKGISPSVITDCCVLCVPIILPSGDVKAIVEFTRDHFKLPFSPSDLQLVSMAMSWICVSWHESEAKGLSSQQEHLNDFLLETTKEIFDEMTCLDTVVKKVMMFTKDLVKAERCALFLVDEEKNELYADYFDIGAPDVGETFEKRSPQIRMPRDKGIAGYVAQTGEVVNIHNAYEDTRFNPEVDKTTGFKTRNILCMPIVSKAKVIGVVEMVNCTRGDHFTHADELAFHTYAVYCALALNYSRVYSLLNQQQNQYKVAMDVLQYHIVCGDEEIQQLRDNPFLDINELPPMFDDFEFCVYDFMDLIPKLFIHMVQEMFGNNEFETEKLCRFILTVKKNYRNVTYHNFEHGFHVSHSLWCMLGKTGDLFTNFEKMALVIAGICHDIDHRGYNNAFFTKLDHPLAALYSTSVMEQHHYKQTVTILHTDGQDIFSFLDHDRYKEILELIRHHILATDLALYFGNQKFMSAALEKGPVNLADDEIRMKAKALMMTGADLCAISKPTDTQPLTVEKLYDEFYMQGDEEKKRGLVPLPMMDRDTVKDQPKQQIGFIDFICIPLYTTLAKVLPETASLLEDCRNNREYWQERVEDS